MIKPLQQIEFPAKRARDAQTSGPMAQEDLAPMHSENTWTVAPQFSMQKEILAASDRRFPTNTPVVYFVQAGDDGPIKIGYSSKFAGVRDRIASLQTGCPWPLVIRRIMEAPDKLRTEAELHERFAEYRLSGEWFANAPGVAEAAHAVERSSSAEAKLVHAAFMRGMAAAGEQDYAEGLDLIATRLRLMATDFEQESERIGCKIERARLPVAQHAASHEELENAA